MICKSEGAQVSKTRANIHLGGSGGMFPQENLDFQFPESVSEAFGGSLRLPFIA